MMPKAIVEHDFFPLERVNSQQKSSNSIRGIQSVVSRLNPNIVRSVMGIPQRTVPPSISIFNPASMPVNEGPPGTTPLTIFYNGTVSVFHVVPDAAARVMRLANEGTAKVNGVYGGKDSGLKSESDLPMARKKTIQRFMEERDKRKQRSSPETPNANENKEGRPAKKKNNRVHIGVGCNLV